MVSETSVNFNNLACLSARKYFNRRVQKVMYLNNAWIILHITEICYNPHSSSETDALLDGLQTHLLSKCFVHKKIACSYTCIFIKS